MEVHSCDSAVLPSSSTVSNGLCLCRCLLHFLSLPPSLPISLLQEKFTELVGEGRKTKNSWCLYFESLNGHIETLVNSLGEL